jgi:hypothetical protein
MFETWGTYSLMCGNLQRHCVKHWDVLQYRAPLAKSKRTLTREKYSALRGGGIQESSLIGSDSSVHCSTLSVSSNSSGQIVTASAVPSIKTSDAESSGTQLYIST